MFELLSVRNGGVGEAAMAEQVPPGHERDAGLGDLCGAEGRRGVLGW